MPIFVGAGTSSFMKGGDGVGVSTMTTTQRNALSGVKKGQFIFNESLNLAQYYDGTAWKPIDSPPVITNFTLDGGSPTTSATIDSSAGGNATIVITGEFFDTTGAIVAFVGTGETLSTASIVRNSATQLTVTVARSGFDNTNEPYALRVTNGSGLSSSLVDAINQDKPPVFTVAAGALANAYNNVPYSASAAATDADGDTVTHSISSGSLPSGLNINSTNGAITGTPSGNSESTFSFTVQAATSGASVTRNYTIAISPLPTGGSVVTSGSIRIHTFTSSADFVVPSGFSKTGEVLAVAGGGGGGSNGNGPSWCDAGGGGGAGGLVHSTSVSITAGTKAIVIGAGGAGGSGSSGGKNRGVNGSNSTTASLVANAIGGGGGGWGSEAANGNSSGSSGGSGGGCNNYSNNGSNQPGAGTAGQGNAGGTSTGNSQSGTGGGGAGAVGGGIATSSSNSVGGAPGGDGLAKSTSGSSVTYAGGGGGGSAAQVCNGQGNSYSGNLGGNGGGGRGGSGNSNSNISAGTANRGGGGGGSAGSNNQNGNFSGQSGGSGIVIIKYDLS
tara:strand:- start:451 stop:2121 length:1671 start_codon:yes stop_codon:yes gene_type:complete